MTSGTLITGQSFSVPTGVVVYNQDKVFASNYCTKYDFDPILTPHVLPSVGAASNITDGRGGPGPGYDYTKPAVIAIN